jgi:cyanophycinase
MSRLKLCLVAWVSSVAAQAGAPTLVPIGGGYDSLPDYVGVVFRSAQGPSVDIAVLPTTYGESRAEALANGDYDVAQEHVTELATACTATVDRRAFPLGCKVWLVELWVASDASDPAIVEALAATTLDAVFILGGDQSEGMEVLAGTPAERALADSYVRGAIISGTSAGNSVLSRTMISGYTDYGDSPVALHLGALDVWFGTPNPLQRGFSFGSTRAIFDQHLYERGRFGRLLNETARTTDHFGRGGLLGIGMDTDTAPVVRDDRLITSVFGASSLTIVDFRSMDTAHKWVGADGRPVVNPDPDTTPTAALWVRNALVHLLAPRARGTASQIEYDLRSRVPSFNGVRLAAPPVGPSAELRAEYPIVLGGDLSRGASWPTDSPVLRAFLGLAEPPGPIIIVAAGYSTVGHAQGDVVGYTQSLARSGWDGAVVERVRPAIVTDAELSAAAGVIFLAPNQGQLPGLLADAAFAQLVRRAHERAPVIMLDRSFVAAAGDVYDAVDDAADWVEAFKGSQAVLGRGLGLVTSSSPVAFEPRLQYDYKFGRLFGIPFAARASKRPVVFGISEGAGLVVDHLGETVVGRGPVMRTTSAHATFYLGDNGAIGALNVVLDAFEPEQRAAAASRTRAPSLLRPPAVPALPKRTGIMLGDQVIRGSTRRFE